MSGECAGIERGGEGGRLTMNLNRTFKTGFAGSKAVWLALQTVTAVTTPWKVSGAWPVPP